VLAAKFENIRNDLAHQPRRSLCPSFLVQVLQKPSLLTNLGSSEQRALLVCVLTVLESIDGAHVMRLWGGREERARALFELLELALELFQVSRL
jgi:hypothetical protein